MRTVLRHSVWLNRAVLGFATFIFSSIALQRMRDPVAAEAAHRIVLGSAEAVTNTRVTGGVFLSLALLLAIAQTARARHLPGLVLLLTVSAVLTAVRLLGIFIDGPAPFTLFVLKPEIAVTLVSALALSLEWRAQRQ